MAGLHDTLGDIATTRIGTELVGTSVSSSFDPDLVAIAETIINALPYIEYGNARDRGYRVVDLTREALRATYRVVSTTESPDAEVSTAHVATVPARSGVAAVPVPTAPSFTG